MHFNAETTRETFEHLNFDWNCQLLFQGQFVYSVYWYWVRMLTPHTTARYGDYIFRRTVENGVCCHRVEIAIKSINYCMRGASSIHHQLPNLIENISSIVDPKNLRIFGCEVFMYRRRSHGNSIKKRKERAICGFRWRHKGLQSLWSNQNITWIYACVLCYINCNEWEKRWVGPGTMRILYFTATFWPFKAITYGQTYEKFKKQSIVLRLNKVWNNYQTKCIYCGP